MTLVSCVLRVEDCVTVHSAQYCMSTTRVQCWGTVKYCARKCIVRVLCKCQIRFDSIHRVFEGSCTTFFWSQPVKKMCVPWIRNDCTVLRVRAKLSNYQRKAMMLCVDALLWNFLKVKSQPSRNHMAKPDVTAHKSPLHTAPKYVHACIPNGFHSSIPL